MQGKAIKSSKRMPHSNTCTHFIEMSEKSIVEKSHPCKKYKMQSEDNRNALVSILDVNFEIHVSIFTRF